MVFLSSKLDELDLHTVLTIEGSNQSIARTLIGNSQKKDQTIATLNSMQGIAAKDRENGVTYLSIMEENLEVLKKALQ